MSSFITEIREYFIKGFIVIIIIGLLSYFISELTYTPQKKPGEYWHNKDYSKSSQDIKNMDYKTGTITYRDYNQPKKLHNIEIESSSIDIEELIDLNID